MSIEFAWSTMEIESTDLATLDTGTEKDLRFDAYNYDQSASNNRPAIVFDLEKEDEVIFIDSAVCGNSHSSTCLDVKPSASKKKVTFVDEDEIEWISAGDESTFQGSGNDAAKPNIYNVDDEIGDCDYSLQIEPHNTENVIDVEQEYSLKSGVCSELNSIQFFDCCDEEVEIRTICSDSGSYSPTRDSTVMVNTIVHNDVSGTHSATPLDESFQESEISDYDARMRACFGLDFSISSIEGESDVNEINRSCSNISMDSEKMECDSEYGEVIDIEDDSDNQDDCVVTSTYLETKSNPSCAIVATVDIENHNNFKRKIIAETVDEIFKRMMPLAVPGALSLFAPERNVLPQNVRPSKFCYYYFISSHIVVKEIMKQEFYKFKEKIMIAKRSKAPPRCNCLSHPLNQNASKLTLLTNPYSLYHKPNCHFNQNSKFNTTRRKGPRRLSYQVSFYRIPQKREGKDFKDWSDIVLRRRQTASNAGNLTSANWPFEEEKANLIQHRPFSRKIGPNDSNEMITIKTEPNFLK